MDRLYYILVEALWVPISSVARGTKQRRPALYSVLLGIIALLLTVLVRVFVFNFVMPLFQVEPRGGGSAAFGVIVCLFLIPFAAKRLQSASPLKTSCPIPY